MSSRSLFVTTQRKPEARIRLFCFPHAGGAPASFFPWSSRLGPEIECVGMQYPGRAQRWREPARSCMSELVDEIVGEWAAAAEMPFAFYGHSFGGLVAFEVARRLRRASMPLPQWLFVGSSRAPQLDLTHPPIHHLPDEDFVDALQARYGGIPPAIRADREVLDLFLAPMRMDLTAYERYRMQEDAPLSVPVTGFAGARDLSVPPACMEGWALQTEAGFELRILGEGHFFSMEGQVAVTGWVRERLLQQVDSQSAGEVNSSCIRAERKGPLSHEVCNSR